MAIPTQFLRSLYSEWQKTRHSAAAWLVLVGGIFVPFILMVVHLLYIDKLKDKYFQPLFWKPWLLNMWESMAVFLLPMGIVLATSLIAQLEYKNNAWKQVHASPQPYAVVFFAKLAVVLLMMVQLFVLFNATTWLAGAVPAWFYGHIPYPAEAFPWGAYLQVSVWYFSLAMPVVGLQYLLSVYFRNFMVSLGIGVVLVVGSLMALSWKYVYLVPYIYGLLGQLKLSGRLNMPQAEYLGYYGVGYFCLFTGIAFILYLYKRDKG